MSNAAFMLYAAGAIVSVVVGCLVLRGGLDALFGSPDHLADLRRKGRENRRLALFARRKPHA